MRGNARGIVGLVLPARRMIMMLGVAFGTSWAASWTP